jgi:hypothetical protein
MSGFENERKGKIKISFPCATKVCMGQGKRTPYKWRRLVAFIILSPVPSAHLK